MPTTLDQIAAIDRQIERVNLRAQQQMLHLDCLDRGHHSAEARREQITLDRMLDELATLKRQRLSLYQVMAFADTPTKEAS